MKKNTFRGIVTLLLCFMAFQTYAQIFPEGTWRLKTYLASPGDYNDGNDPPFEDQYVYPTAGSGDAIALTLEDLTSENQVFEFKPLTGDAVEWPAASGAFYQVYNIESKVPGKGVMELNTLTQSSHRMRLRGNSHPFANDLARFIVVQSPNMDDLTYHIIAAGATDDPDRRIWATTNYDWLNFGGPAGSRPGIDEWIFEAATLSAKDFDSSSVFVSNPVNNELVIESLTDNIKEISVYNLLGKQVFTNRLDGKTSVRIDVATLSSGVYIVEMKGDNVRFSKKIVKQ